MEIKLKISLLYVVLASLVFTAYGSPVDSLFRFVKRETPCIALGDCPGMNPPRPSSSSQPAPQPTTQHPSPSSAAPAPSTHSTPPASSTTGSASVQTPVQRIFLDTDTCDDTQKGVINQAWNDAGLLARAAGGGQLNYDYTIPATEWLGKWWNFPGFFPIWSDYQLIISRNKGRQLTLHTDNVASGIWIYLSCPKQHDACSPGTIAASADSNRLFWKNHYTLFCPLFFQQDSMTTSINNVRSDPQEQEIMDNYWGNQGFAFFHETYHYGGSVSDPRAKDYCYKADACWDMAADTGRSTGWAMVNADSYSLEATAIYMQQYFRTPRPAVPRKYTIALNQPTNATNTTTKPPGPFSDPDAAPPQPTKIFSALDAVPTDLFGDVTGDSITSQDWTPGSKWEVISGPPL